VLIHEREGVVEVLDGEVGGWQRGVAFEFESEGVVWVWKG